MKKYRTTLLIAAIAVVVVGVLYAVMWLWPDAEPEVTPSPTPTAVKTTLVNLTRTEVDRITLTAADGTALMVYSDTTKARVTPAKQGFAYSSSQVATLYAALLTLDSERTVSENPGGMDLVEMGLSPPAVVCRLHTKSGEVVKLSLGKLNVLGAGYFVQLNDDPTVYIVSKYRGDTMMKPESDYRDLSFLPNYDAEVDYSTLFTAFSWQHNGRPVEMVRRTVEEIARIESLDMSHYVLTQPFEAEANDAVVYNVIINTLKTIRPSKVVEDDPEDLARYGLDNPVTLTVQDVRGWSGTLLVGKKDTESGGRFVMLPDTSAVLLDTSSDYAILDMSPASLRNSLLFIYPIADVLKAEVTFDGVTRVLEMDEQKATDTTEASFSCALDGGEILEINARRLFQRMIAFMIEDEVPEGATLGRQRLKVVFRMRDGDTHVMELRELNERHFAVIVDGQETGFYVNVSKYTSLVDGFAVADTGERIPPT